GGDEEGGGEGDLLHGANLSVRRTRGNAARDEPPLARDVCHLSCLVTRRPETPGSSCALLRNDEW
ncbi:MAG TPA: hypothetical protein PLN53_08080, partial [Terricaulis sp.]|nr:hypothetical protein [Terricaulis sp.]